MDLRNFNGFELGALTLQPYRSFFGKFSSEVEKKHHLELNSGASKSSE